MKSLDERLNGLRWRLQAMRRLWSPGVKPNMTFLPPRPPEHGAVGQIDRPSAGTEIDPGTLMVGGWVTFDSAPTGRCEIWLGERPLGRARLGVPRTDVGEETAMPHAGVSGFELSVDPSPPLEAGPAQLRAVATAADGRSYEMDPVPVVVGAAAAAPRPSSPPAPVPVPTGAKGPGLRTLVITHQLNLGGAQLYLMDLLRGLAAKGGYEPTVISAMDGALREELEEMGIPVHVTSVSQQEDLSSHLGRIEELTSWAAPREFERAFVNTATALVSPPAEAAARLGIPTVWAIHESFEPAILWGHLDPEVRARAEATLAEAAFAVFEADATQRIFEPLLGADRCRMLPYGLDLAPIDAKRADFDAAAARQQAGLPAESRIVVCVGTVEPRKAQIPLALAFERIAERHPEAHLAFVGGREGDPYSLALEESIAASPRRSQMSLIPVTPDVDSWYGMADLLVCASDVESLPRTVLEAMAWETPVLATSVFGLPELITDGETGWLCEPRDVSALATALDRALSSPADQRRRVAVASRRLVEQRHSLTNYADEVGALLERAKGAAAAGNPDVAAS